MGTENDIAINCIGGLSITLPESAILVENDVDYVMACCELRSSYVSGKGVSIWVRSTNHYTWLKNYIDKTGIPAVLREQTARTLLEQKWNVRLPEWVSESDINEQGLLDSDIDTQKTDMSFIDVLLSNTLGAAFRSPVLDRSNLAEVVNVLVEPDVKTKFKKNPVLRRCLEEKCALWIESSEEDWAKAICDELHDSPERVWQWLSIKVGLHSYPDKLLEYVLSPKQVEIVQSIPFEAISDIHLEETARDRIVTQIKHFFMSLGKVASSEEFQKMLSCVSGKFIDEFRHVRKILDNAQFSPQKIDIEDVRQKFSNCPGVSSYELNSLFDYVNPDRPALSEPGDIRGREKWVRWTTEEYIPYRDWQVKNNYFDEDIEKEVKKFSEWYIEEYERIQKEPELSLIHCLRDLQSDDAEEELAVVILIDCLPAKFFSILDGAVKNIGFSRNKLQYRFAALPTATEYNKYPMLSGRWDNSEGDYEKILKHRSEMNWGGKPIQYITQIKDFLEMDIPQSPSVVLLNTVAGDDILHSEWNSKGSSYEEELHSIFVRIAEALNRFAEGWQGKEEDFSAYIVTDHGACRILEQERCSLDSKAINKLFRDERYRYAAIEEHNVDEISDNLWSLGYQFKLPFSSDDQRCFFLPKGHNTVRSSGRVKGCYMHGGVTPEEVIVPYVVYKQVKSAWKKPNIHITDVGWEDGTGAVKFYIQRVETFTLEIQNINTADLEVKRVSITEPGADVKDFDSITISAGDEGALRVSCYFEKDALDADEAVIELVCEISGEEQIYSFAPSVAFKSAMAGGVSLRDL